MSRLWMFTILAPLAFGCGSASPESLCEQIFKRRVEGPIRSFKENGPKNKEPFMKYCVAQPPEYLACEAKGMEGLMAAGEEKAKACVELLKQYQEGLNRVLERGEAATALQPSATGPR